MCERLARADCCRTNDGGWRRVIVEKPFGTDLHVGARAQSRPARRSCSEQQIYRIDHYLGKETVQNILVFRFGNGIFEPIWNRRYVDHVQITVAETLGVEMRGGYYDQAGALRDMVPEPPVPDPDAHRDGAAELARRQRAAQRAGQGPRSDRAARHRDECSSDDRARAIRSRRDDRRRGRAGVSGRAEA